MATVESYFGKFVSNLNPDDDAINNASVAHNALRDHLSESELYGECYSDSFLYGSYKRHTAIHDIDDVDVCVLVNIDHTSEDGNPKKVLRKLKKAITEYYSDVEWYDDENTAYNRRSILVKDALPNNPDSQLSLDVIPAVQDPDSDYLLVPDKEIWEWVQTNPKWHIDFSQEMNDASNQEFIKIVKIFKHLKKHHIKNKHPKGFWIETLVWVCYEQGDSMAESFYETLLNIIEKYGSYEKALPKLPDFWMPGETIKTSMELKHFLKFIELLRGIQEDVKDAIDTEDKEYCIAIWRNIFGETHFPKALQEIVKYASSSEEFITEKYSFTEEIDSVYSLKIECYTLLEGQKLFGKQKRIIKSLVKRGTSIKDNSQTIKFERVSNCPTWTQYFWKVRNYWPYAQDNIRWEIWAYTNVSESSNIEHLAYIGTHTVECYAVYQWKIVAKDLFKVTINW